MKKRKLLAAAISLAMCVPILPTAELRTEAELVPESVVYAEESAKDISYAAVMEAESTSASKTTSTTKKKTTTTTKKSTTTTKKSTTTTKKTTTTTTKKTTTTAKQTAASTTVTTVAPLMLGDIDNNKMITGSDATLILREYTLISGESDGELTEIQRKACDVDRDNRITASDATLTLRYYIYEGSGGVLELEDFIKYGPIDIQTTTTTTTTTSPTTQSTTTTTTALDTETTSTETDTEPLPPPTTQSTTTTTTALYTGTTTGKTSTETETGTTTAPPYIDPDIVQGITLSHYSVSLKIGDGDMPLVTMHPETALDKSEKWWSSDKSVATVNSEGWIVGIAPGECTVTVQSVDNPDVTAEIKVIVIEETVEEIVLDRDEIIIPVNKGDMPLVTMYPVTAPDKSEKWWSSDTSVATVNYEGWILGIKPGECIVTVQSVANPDVKAEIKVIVTDEGLVKDIVLDRYEIELFVGDGDMPLVTMLPEDAEDKSEKWISSDKSVATVNYEGWIVGIAPGECTITVYSAVNPEIKAEIKVIVKEK
ncbi:MAG: Ig-like domain-containing protein [Ruminococcus sp.]|nr:Ig-like domain-containing protein [Ruminococcus sp.]